MQILSDLVYTRRGERSLALDLYVPERARATVVWIHGGAWLQGNKDNPPSASLLVERGFAIASISYRFSSEATFPAQLEDCRSAVRWLRANGNQYGVPTSSLGAWGASSGGHLVALLGTAARVDAFDVGEHLDQPAHVQAVCDWFGPTDFLQMDGNAAADSAIVHDAPDSPESLLVGGPIQEQPQRVAEANPISYVDRSAPPFLIIHGDRDRLVPCHQSELLARALDDVGAKVELVRLAGAGHGGEAFRTPEVAQRVIAFFQDHLV
jgi:acetyl esterase/lipase